MSNSIDVKPDRAFWGATQPRVSRGRPSSQLPIIAAIRSLVTDGKLPNALSRKQNIELVRVRVHEMFPGQFARDIGLARETIANYLAQEFSTNKRSSSSSHGS